MKKFDEANPPVSEMPQRYKFICTSEQPWTKEVRAKVILHPAARLFDGVRGCPICGYSWKDDER